MNTNTATAGNVAGQAGEKEKVEKEKEKRKALGRGLAALFSGPRVVPANNVAVSPSVAQEAAPRVPAPVTARTPVTAQATDPLLATPARSGAPAVPESPAFIKGSAAPAVPISSPRAEEISSPGPVAVSDHEEVVAASIHAVVNEAAAADDAPLATGEVHYDAYEESVPGETIEIQAVADKAIPQNLVVNVPIADIDKNPFQTRYVEDDEALEELAESIRANGVVQPIVVRPAAEEGRYILILGERRLHASKKVGKTHIPALVRRVSVQQAAEMTIIENLQREDLSPLEQAEAFRVLSNEFKLTQEQIGQRVGLSRVSVANYMRLLKLPRDVMQLLAEKKINFAQAKELLKLENNDRIAEAALYAMKKGMNLEQIELLVLRMEGMLDPLPDMPGVQKKEEKTGGARWVDPNVRAAQMDLERLLGVRVRIRDRKGRGKIVIEYSTVDDYERVVEMLRGAK